MGATAGPQPAPDAVARRRAPDRATDGEPHPRRDGGGISDHRHPQRTYALGVRRAEPARTPRGPGCARSRREASPALGRRDLMMARPARVDIRCRNPWRFARLRLFGWYVRFTLPPE